MKLVEQSVIVHLFAPLTGPVATEAVSQIRGFWRRCATELGMVDGIPALGLPVEPLDLRSGSPASSPLRSVPVAARQRIGDGIWQAVWLHDHDVACVSIALSTPGSSWDDVHAAWRDATTGIGMDALLGVVEEFVGLVAGFDTLDGATDVPDEIRAQLPPWMVDGRLVDPTWTQRGVSTRAGYAIWQPTTPTVGPGMRRLLILTTPSREAGLSNFVWNPGPEPTLAPLTAYLLDAARLMYSVRVWQDAGGHEDLRRHASAALDNVDYSMRAATAGHPNVGDLDLARRHLASLRLIEASLAEAASRVAQLRAAVRSWTDNLNDHTRRHLTPAALVDVDNGYSHDRRVASWFERQLLHDDDIIAAVRDEAHQRGVAAACVIVPDVRTAEPGRAAPSGLGPVDEATIVVLTAIDVEHQAVRQLLTDVVTAEHRGAPYLVGRLLGTPARIVVTQLGVGNIGAAVLTERTIAGLRPSSLVFAGVAGALHEDLALGDVVVATWIYAYHSGAEQNGQFLARPRAWPATYHLLQRARLVASALTWAPTALTSAGRAPRVVFRPVASGDVVVDGRDSPTRSQLRSHYDDAAAIEMESAGAAEAAYLNGAVPILTVRGISDHASGGKTTTDTAGWQSVAATNAAIFACALIAAL